MGNTYNRVYIWCCKYDENRYCERCANKWWCTSKHTGLLNSCLGKWCLLPYLVVPLISTRLPLISTRVSAHCQATLLHQSQSKMKTIPKLQRLSLEAFLWSLHRKLHSYYMSPTIVSLTHRGRDEIYAILRTTSSNAFSWMKMQEFRLKCYWI